MDLKIKDKHKFIDLATYGSLARTEVRPDVYIGSERFTSFKDGDLLDANATHSLIQLTIENNLNLKWFNTNSEFKIELYAGNIGENDICFIVDIAAIYKGGNAIGWLDKSQLLSIEAEYKKAQALILDFNSSLELDKTRMRDAYKEVTSTANHINNELAKLDFDTEFARLKEIEEDLKDELHNILYAVQEVDVIPTDTEPREDSQAFLRSGAIYKALAGKINGDYTEEEYLEQIQSTESWEKDVLYVMAEE